MNAINAIFYLLAIFALVGALGVTLSRSYVYAVMSLLVSIVSVCGILFLLNIEILSAMILWFLGATSTLILLHTSLLVNMRQSEKSPRRLLVGKLIYGVITLQVALSVFLVLPSLQDTEPNAIAFNLEDLTSALRTNYAFLIFLIFATAPFIMISSLLLTRREVGLSVSQNADDQTS